MGKRGVFAINVECYNGSFESMSRIVVWRHERGQPREYRFTGPAAARNLARAQWMQRALVNGQCESDGCDSYAVEDGLCEDCYINQEIEVAVWGDAPF